MSIADQTRAVHERIQRWIAEENWATRRVRDEGAIFSATVTVQIGQSVDVYQRNEHLDHITIAQRLFLEGPSFSALAELPGDVISATILDIHRDAVLLGLEFEGLDVPPRALRYHTSIYFDGLTKDALVQRIGLVHRAQALAVLTFARALMAAGEPSSAAAELLRIAS